jgi:probable O-glycosylation ligase (exosortase A-associated)
MLRMIFVLAIIGVGAFYSLYGPFYALLFYLWNAYFRPELWTYGGLIFSLRLSFFIYIYLIGVTVLTGQRPRFNTATALIGLFFLQCVVGVVASEHRALSYDYLIVFGKVLLISYLIVMLVNTEERVRLTLLVMGLSLGFECAKQGWVDLYRAPGRVNNNLIAFLGDNNGVALGTMMLAAILIAVAQASTKRWQKYALGFVAVGVVLRGLSTYSRGGFLAASVLGLLTLARAKRKLRSLVIVGVFAAAVASYMPPEFWGRMSTITVEEGEEREESSAGRLHFWQVAMEMAAQKPLTGVGLNAYNYSYESYNWDDRFAGMRSSHSIWFGTLGDLGYPGLVLFIANWAWAVYSCFTISRRARKDPALRNLGIYANGVMVGLVVYAVAGSFLPHHYNEMAWHYIGLSAALSLVARERATAPITAPVRSAPAAQPLPAAVRPAPPAVPAFGIRPR